MRPIQRSIGAIGMLSVGLLGLFARSPALQAHTPPDSPIFGEEPNSFVRSFDRSQVSLTQPIEFKGTDGAPGDREDAASRNNCRATSSFLALVPVANLSTTLAAHPTFWLYLPQPSGVVELQLEDPTSSQTIYQTRFSGTGGPGILHFRLPETAPDLEVGKEYRWYFFLYCNAHRESDLESDYYTISGVVRRESLTETLASQLETATPRERILIFAQNGLWHETLMELVAMRRASPEDARVTEDWETLFGDPLVQLEDVLSAPLLDCCTSEPQE